MEAIEFRRELKHEINLTDYYTLRPGLQAVMRQDPHAGPDGWYHIRSLYFDNDDDMALKAKINGLLRKEKFRIRIYNGKENVIRLEKKIKENELCGKQAAFLTRGQCERILAGDMDWILDTNAPVLLEFYAKARGQRLKPKTLVDYRREAYIYPFGNVRITFDSDIRSGLYATGIFDSEVPTVQVSEPGTMLLEIKYDQFMPDLIRDIIQAKNRRSTAFSKYAVSRIYG